MPTYDVMPTLALLLAVFGFGLFGLDLVVLETLLCILLRASEDLCGDILSVDCFKGGMRVHSD